MLSQVRIVSGFASYKQPFLKPSCPSAPVTHAVFKIHGLYCHRFAAKPSFLEVAAAQHSRLSPLLPLKDLDSAAQTLLPPSGLVYKKGEFVEVGNVKAAFGIVGELRIEISTDNPKQRFRKGAKLYLQPPRPTGLLLQSTSKEQPLYQIQVQSSKVRILPKGQEMWVLKCAEVTDRDVAEQLSGYKVVIPIAHREQLKDPDEFWVQDLVDCEVFLQDTGERVGVVIDIVSGTGTYDMMVVQLNLTPQDVENSTTRRCMVPFVKVMCPEVDLQQRRILINPPEGLLDLASKKPMGKKLRPEQKEALLAELKAGRQPSLAHVRSTPSSSSSSSSSNLGTAPSSDASSPSAANSSKRSRVDAEVRRKARPKPATQRAPAPNQQQEEVESEWAGEDGEGCEDDEVESSSRQGEQRLEGGIERWRLRRSLGASFGTRQIGGRNVRSLRGRRGLSRDVDDQSDSDSTE